METCQAWRKDGRRCTMRPRPDRPYCFAHDPDLAHQRQQANVTGGQNKARARRLDKLTPATLRPLIGTLMDALERVDAGTLEPKQATAMASLAGAVCRVYELGQLEASLAETQTRLAALERGKGA